MGNYQFQKAIVVGDAFISSESMVEALEQSKLQCTSIAKKFWGTLDKQEFTTRQLKVERGGPEAVAFADGLLEEIKDAEVILTHFNPIPKELIDAGTSLKYILTCRGGLEHIDVAYAKSKNITVVNVIRNAEPVADFALGLILSITRNISLSHEKMKRGIWEKNYYNKDNIKTLDSYCVGLAGVGNIGIALSKRLLALGVKVIAHDAYITKETIEKNDIGAITFVDSLEALFATADIISLHLRLTAETEKMIDKKYFSLMKETAYFMNTARGGLVNEADLVDALESQKIAGAALDVYDAEPLDIHSKILQMDQVVLTPHIAGLTVDAIPRAPYMLMKKFDTMY
ncbi:MAG: 2-hydroxyacid dehydrogenase [Bacillota bacterium]